MTFSSVVAPPQQLPFQLLEINIISAQDLAPISRKIRTYAIAWIHPERKLSTRVDSTNKNNPTWNDKFVFRVDDAFLRSDTSAVMIEIYDINSCFKDKIVGSVRVLVSNLIPPAARMHQTPGMRFVALQIRRPSGRPQGILNLGVALLDGSLRSMPLYTKNNGSAVGYRDLMGEKPNSPNHHHNPKFRRSRSERHSNVTDMDFPQKSGFIGSDFGEPPLATITTTGSMWSESDVGPAPSSVAAQMLADEVLKSVKNNINNNNNNNNSSHSHSHSSNSNSNSNNVLDKWGQENTVEDLKTKLERWRTELPPVFDHRGSGGLQGKQKTDTRHVRRHTEGGSGVFSCFGDLYGLECSISCGLKSSENKKNRKGKGKGKNTFYGSDDDDEVSQSFI